MGKSRAAIQAAYRARKKKQLGEKEFLKQESDRVQKYYVPVNKLSRKEKKERREEVNSRVRRHRGKKKKILQDIEARIEARREGHEEHDLGEIEGDSQEVTEVSDDRPTLIVKLPFTDSNARKTQTRKRTSRAVSAAHRRISALEKKLEDSQRLNKTLRKRYERECKNEKVVKKPVTAPHDKPETSNTGPSIASPRSRVRAQLYEVGLSPRSVPRGLKRQLQFSHSIVDEVRNASEKTKKHKEKGLVSRLISGRVIKKYRFLSQAKKYLKIDRRALARASSKDLCLGLTEQRLAWVNLQNDVLSFLERDDNSRVMPGKKDACKSGGAEPKSQIRVLNDYLNNLYEKYKSENADKRHISLSAFKRVRQRNPHIKLVNFMARNTSLCQKHQNMSLMLKALATKTPGLSSKSPDDFIAKFNDEDIDMMLRKTKENESVQNIDFDEWKRVPTESGQKKTKLVHIVLGKEQFAAKFQKSVKEFRDHVERVKVQYNSIQQCKQSLSKYECVAHMDFAENYTCVPLDEVQSGYWNQASVTLHPVVIYYRDPEDNSLKHQSYVAVSDDRSHNTSTIMAILESLVPKVTTLVPGLKRIHYWTDSPTAQYRNKTIFSLVADHHVQFPFICATWNYFEAGHGKGPCDGVGGTVKRLADDGVKRGAVIQDAHDFYSWAVQEREKTKVEYFFVSKDECSKSHETIKKWSQVKSITGTLQLHAVIGLGEGKVMWRNLSCFCPKCEVSDPTKLDKQNMCSGWVVHTFVSPHVSQTQDHVQPNTIPNATRAHMVQVEVHLSRDGLPAMPISPTVRETPALRVLLPQQAPQVQDMDEIHTELPIYQTDEWVAGLYDDNWYIGQVIDSDDGEVHINFMKSCSGRNPSKNTYSWPTVEDKLWIPRDDVLCQIEPPTRVSRRVYQLSSQQIDLVSDIFWQKQNASTSEVTG